MDPNAVVLEISSDEEVGWEGHDGRGISITDGGDDHNWIAELLDEVNRDDCGYYDGADDSDEVVLVSEVLPSKKPRKKLTSKSSSLIDLDDDCVILDHDPDKSLGTPNDTPIAGAGDEDDDDSDDLLVVSEKGQVACRDYPHPRHLCIKFPFSSSPNQTHCHQCYCYVCDSLAPCIYWGSGSSVLDHCLATDKDDFWKLERQNSKKESKLVQSVLELADPSRLPPINLPPPASDLFPTQSAAQSQVTRPSPMRASPNPPNFGVPDVVIENRSPFLLSRNKYQPGLVSQQLIKTTSFTNPRDRGQPNYNLAIPFHGPVFKRRGSAAVPPAGNRHSYSSYRDRYRNSHPPSGGNPCRQQDHCVNEMVSGPNIVNTSGSFSPLNLGLSTTNSEQLPEFPHHQPSSNTTQFEFSPSFQPEVNSDVYIENPVGFQPHLVTCQPQGQSFLPNYAIPCEAPIHGPSIPILVYTKQGNEAQRQNIDPGFFQGISWPLGQSGGRSSVVEGTTATNVPSVPGGLVDYEYDNWGYNCEAGAMEFPGALESGFVETENGRRNWC
ncbi:uncharacterized protein LOC112505076 isoform X2 [Cynara cardunculus var. scolymus]|uniref:uncharacterized protein LOC112505076 isoform X2 n=1 Tax=Cynara cardunculus var. scolymus TaxID=59895 RepID=UPI000D62EFAB|nr:uncharacterized protein LOC112505076 isoform X2 [Cynara cardunculus var. scolymus]